jgi:hypothetical protein
MEEGYLRGTGDDEDGPAAAHLVRVDYLSLKLRENKPRKSMYGLGSLRDSKSGTPTLDADATALHVG